MTSAAQKGSCVPASVLALLRAPGAVLIVGHQNPDGDCLGSQVALAELFSQLGREARILNPNAPASHLAELAAAGRAEAFDGGPLPGHELCVFTDLSELGRTGALARPLAAHPSTKLVVDHHVLPPEAWWDEAYTDTSAASTGVLVARLGRALGAALSPLAAEALFTSLVTDTGWFQYPNTDAETFRLAAELVAAGIAPAELYARLHQRNPVEQPALLARLLARAEYRCDERVALVAWPLEEGAGRAPDEALYDKGAVLDILRGVEPVEVVLFVREFEPQRWKLSARSKRDADVHRLASRFGGGGHRRAAGAVLEGDGEGVRAALFRAAAAALEEMEASGVGARAEGGG